MLVAHDEVLDRLTDWVRRELLGADSEESAELTPDAPLLQWGVLNSMNTARLLAFIREELGVAVPPQNITGRYFKSLSTINELVLSLAETGV